MFLIPEEETKEAIGVSYSQPLLHPLVKQTNMPLETFSRGLCASKKRTGQTNSKHVSLRLLQLNLPN